MRLTHVTGTGQLAQRLRETRRELVRRTPRRTPGVLTSVTVAGTTQRPIVTAKPSAGGTTTSGYIAIWL